jgi:hypothetical protein
MPPDVDENLASVQEIQTAIEPLNNGVRIPVTHHLNDVDDNPLTPDEVIVEVMSYPDESPSNPCNIVGHTRIPSSPEDGTFELELRASDANLSGQNWDITVRVTCLYHHSVQSDDHVAELTAEAGVQINDCTPEPPENLEIWSGGSVAYTPDQVAWGDIFTGLPPPYTGQEANFESLGIMSPAAGTVWSCGARFSEVAWAGYWDGVAWTIWTPNEEPAFTFPLEAIHGWDANNAFVVNLDSDVFQWAGGPNWIDHSPSLPANSDWYCVWGTGPNDVWIGGNSVGGTPYVAHWNGATWDGPFVMPGGTPGQTVHGIWGVDANNVWFVGGDGVTGKVWYWNGAGFSDVTPATIGPDPRDIYGLDANNMYICSTGGAGLNLVLFDGTNAVDLTDPAFIGNQIDSVFAYASDDVWMCSHFNQFIYHWDGVAWTNVPHGVVSPNINAWNYITGVWY